MPHLNNCSFMGHVGQPATLKQSKDGSKNWYEFTMAVSTGSQAQPETMWVKCRGFGKTGERMAEKVTKGDAVYVTGKLNCKAYARKQDGQPAADVSLLVNEFVWLRPSSKSESAPIAIPEFDVKTVDGLSEVSAFGSDGIPF
jgi:single-stranded DNA-binding protein